MSENNNNLSLEERRFLFEKETEEKKIELQKLEWEIRKLEAESKFQTDKKSLRNISPVTATILVALISFLATAIATYFQGQNTNSLEQTKFQSSLILKALEQPSQEDRVKFLSFLTALKLIDNARLSNNIDSFITKTPENIPFIPTYSTMSVNDSVMKLINEDLFLTCVINKETLPSIDNIVDSIIANKSRYEKVSISTNVPWQAIALVHYAEAGFNFNKHLINGDPLTDRTVNYPAGLPPKGAPPFTWEESAINCLISNAINKNTDWSTKGLLTALEKYNGSAYRLKYKMNTPYLWGGSNHYTKGAYTQDAKFDTNKVSRQIGVGTILKAMEAHGLYKYQAQ
jgi:lysozyme family protein